MEARRASTSAVTDAGAAWSRPRRATIHVPWSRTDRHTDYDSSEDEGGAAATIRRRASDAFSNRERRLSMSAEALRSDRPIGDRDVALIQEPKEWAGVQDSDEEQTSTKVEEARTQQRERRLSVSAEVLKAEKAIGDIDVEVQAQGQEWADDSGEDEISPTQFNTGSFKAREQRLSISVEALKVETLVGDADVHVVPEAKEWAGVEDSDDENDVGAPAAQARRSFIAREDRLSVSAEAMNNDDHIIADKDVELLTQSTEWSAAAESDDETPATLEQHAEAAYQAREARIGAAGDFYKGEELLGDQEVEVLAQGGEWAGGGPDSDEEDTPGGMLERRERVATDAFDAREKRLEASKELLEDEEKPMGDADVAVVTQAKEWHVLLDDDSDNEEDMSEDMLAAARTAASERRASQAFELREKRLSVSAIVIEQDELKGDTQVELVPQTTDWAALEADDDEEEDMEAQERSRRLSATDMHEAREKRLSFAVQVLTQEVQLGDAEVEVVVAEKDWAGAVDSDDEDGGVKMQVMQRRHSVSSTAREKRMTVSSLALDEAKPIGDIDVELLPEPREWAVIADDDDDDTGVDWKEEAASLRSRIRERRLTVSEKALRNEDQPLGDADVEVVEQEKEWAAECTALADSSDDDSIAAPASAPASPQGSTTPRGSTTPSNLSVQAAAAHPQHQTSAETNQQAERHARKSFNQRERRLSVGTEILKLVQHVPDTEVNIVSQEKEWSANVVDSDEDKPREQRLSRRHSGASAAREKRMTVGAEALKFMGQSVLAGEEPPPQAMARKRSTIGGARAQSETEHVDQIFSHWRRELLVCKAQEFNVEITKREGVKLGIDVDYEFADCLLIDAVSGGGLVAEWNIANPNKQVEVGDCIVAVNGASGTGEQLIQRVKEDKYLNMAIRRQAPDDQTEELKKQEAEEAAVATKIQAIHRGNAIRKGSKQSTEQQQKKAANGDAADVKPVDDAAAATANGEANAKAAGSEAKSEAVVEGVPVDADKSAQAAAAPPKSNSLAVPEQPEGRSSSKSSTGSRGGEMRLKKAIYDKKEQDKKTSPEELG